MPIWKKEIYFISNQNSKKRWKCYDLAIKVSNSFADAHLWKGKCQEALGQKEEAKISYQRAYAFDKTLTEAKEAAR
jgi:tetratricopeptide (TPR) repeat protein